MTPAHDSAVRPRADLDLTPVLHVDMDAFYASVAARDEPELQNVPVIVGGGSRGVVLSANYLARRNGVTSAMPMVRARRLCPDAVVLEPDFDLFSVVSASVLENFRDLTPKVEMMSVDEAFLDVGGLGLTTGSAVEVAEQIRSRIHDEQRITCSVGVAATPTIAKIASKRAKPDGVVRVRPDEVLDFLHPLDVGELWGVGPATRSQLHRLGLFTVADVARLPVATLQRVLGAKQAIHLHELANGVDRRVVTPRSGPHAPERSTGADHTFERDVDDPAVIDRQLLRLSTKVAARLRAAGQMGHGVTLRLRFADFTTITRSRRLTDASDHTLEIHRAVAALHHALGLQRARVRLVGVRVDGLVPARQVQRQLELGAREVGWTEAEQAVDAAARRFGSAVIRPASLL